MRYSDNYNLKLPQRGVDRANVDDLDSNFETIDGALADDRQISLLMHDSTATYNTGDIRGYENPTTHRIRAYRCLEDNVTGTWDATKWVQTTLAAEIGQGGGGSSTFAGLSDVSFSNLANGQVPQYNSTSGKWENANPTGGASDLSDLDDVSLTTPTEGQILTYDGDEWVNADAPDVDVTKTAEGNPIEISDGANAPLVKCVTEIQGYQDLHGYDKPWVGGAGKNKARTYTFTRTNSNVTFAYDNNGVTLSGTANGNVAIPFSSSASNFTFNLPAGTYTSSMTPTKEGVTVQIVDQSTGNVLSNNPTFTIANDMVVYFRLSVTSGTVSDGTYKIQLESGSTATAYEPYSNICPITAYTEGEIEVRGKNLFNKDASGVLVGYAIDANNGTTYVTSSGTWNTSDYIDINGINSITIYDPISTDTYDVVFFDSDKTYISGGGFGGNNRVISVPSNASFVRFDYRNTTDSSIMLIITGGDTTVYEPYTSTTHTTTYPSAIYRGSEDVVNGEVETQKIVLKKNTSTMNNAENYPGWAGSGIADILGHGINRAFPNSIMNIGTVFNVNTTGTLDILFLSTMDYGLTQSEWIALAIDVEIVIELPTPTTSSVTPTNLPIKSLSGYNHIESSTGEMEIEYITGKYNPIIEIAERETKTIDEMLTENIESSMVASQNYTTGELIIACGKIYRATANIASGSNLTVGTNVVKTTIEAEIARSGGGANYSTTEHIVGTFIDGSTLYEKTFHCNPVIRVNANAWATVATLSEDITIIDIEAFVSDSNGSATYPVGGAYDNNSKELTVFNPRTTADIQLLYVTIHYTKSS